MSSFNDFSRSFQVNAAMSAGRVVALSSNSKIGLAACDAANAIGVLEDDVTSNTYENPKVRLFGAGSRLISITGCPCTAGDVMVVCTNGQVSVTNGRAGDSGVEIGILVENAGTNGQLKEVILQAPRIT
jgi:hypothetical protein